MSLQDDIFDVEEVLDGTVVVNQFNNILRILNMLEGDCDKLREENNTLKKAIQIIGDTNE